MNIFGALFRFSSSNFPPKMYSSTYRSFNLNPVYKPEMVSGTYPNNGRNHTLPRDYERMMQKVMFRVGPTTIGSKRLKRMVMSKRESTFSEDVRLSTAEGREIMYRRLLNGKRNLVPFGK